ncbi:kunitz trypsin inhibitor 2-like [Cynara cardunculus var. scolymus]|uniref:kunitz trypsin inhibitor 2-like n=1 Tax=Cynara cardunculus var. scolymus TaxID=59895 RepID=UPI000D62B53C|nr:kunitz trypsin inhibitor 2-like [Cynara cardunculus var. scolymus]
MKPSLFFLPFLLFLLTTQTQSISSATTDDFIYDIAGKKVDKNSPYYIGPVNGGGIKLSNSKCPVHVIQDPKKADSFEFVLNAAKEQFLRISYPLGVSIDLTKSNGKCKESSFLKIDDMESKPPANFIRSGGLFNTPVSCFQLVKYPKPTNAKVASYLLQLCPSVCGAGPSRCFNISSSVHKGIKYLGASGTPLELVFKKASA